MILIADMISDRRRIADVCVQYTRAEKTRVASICNESAIRDHMSPVKILNSGDRLKNMDSILLCFDHSYCCVQRICCSKATWIFTLRRLQSMTTVACCICQTSDLGLLVIISMYHFYCHFQMNPLLSSSVSHSCIYLFMHHWQITFCASRLCISLIYSHIAKFCHLF